MDIAAAAFALQKFSGTGLTGALARIESKLKGASAGQLLVRIIVGPKVDQFINVLSSPRMATLAAQWVSKGSFLRMGYGSRERKIV